MKDLFGHESVLGLRKSDWIDVSESEREEIVDKIFIELRSNGFPHFNLSLNERRKVVQQLLVFDPKTIVLGDIIGQNMMGQNLLNHHMPHIWSVRSRGFRTPMEMFLSDKCLRGVIRKRLRLGDNISLAGIRKTLGFAQGAQKVSSFRPTAAKAIYWLLGAETVLDFSAGFGGRLLGAMSLKAVSQYVGVDPSTPTVNGLRDMIREYQWGNRAEIIHAPFEDVKLQNRFDLAFSSPPYFNTEEYSDDPQQSFRRYDTRFLWRNRFLRPTIEKCFRLVKSGGKFAINVANVSTYPDLETHVAQDSIDAGFVASDKLRIAFSKLMGADFKYEPLFVFTKP